MKLDRNVNETGIGKYININVRKLGCIPTTVEELAAAILKNPDAVNFGNGKKKFFIIMLDDKFARIALTAYAYTAMLFDREYGEEILALARSCPEPEDCKFPD